MFAGLMMLVRLLKNVDYYEAGTLCGWPDEKAVELVARGLAEIVEPVASVETPAAVVAAVVEAPEVTRAMPSPKGKAKKA